MIDMSRLDQANRQVRFGDHVDFVGELAAVYVGLIVDIAENGDMVVARPGAKDTLFDPRQLRVSKERA